MKAVIFTKKNSIYSPFIDTCKSLFSQILIVQSEPGEKFMYNIDAIFHEKKDSKNYSSFANTIQEFNPDLLISFCYNRIIQKEIINICKTAVNFHSSLLPNYSGAHALNWQIINGESISGVTVHKLTEKLDGGDIHYQRSFPLLDTDDANDVLVKVVSNSIILLNKLVEDFSNSTIPFYEQTLTGTEFICRPRNEKDGIITKNLSSLDIYNLSRALVPPWPGVYYFKKGKKIKINNVINIEKAELIIKTLEEG